MRCWPGCVDEDEEEDDEEVAEVADEDESREEELDAETDLAEGSVTKTNLKPVGVSNECK